MAGTQRLLAIAMAFFLAGIPGSGKADVLGIVVLADHANAGSLAAAEGTTIYDGDRFSTDAGGALRLQVGEAFVSLAEHSCVMVHKGASGAVKEFEAELVSGIVVLSVAKGTVVEIVASGARVRPLGAPRGVVQVQTVKPLELVVFARKGQAEVSYHGESETVEQGKSVRVLLNPDEAGGRPGRETLGKARQGACGDRCSDGGSGRNRLAIEKWEWRHDQEHGEPGSSLKRGKEVEEVWEVREVERKALGCRWCAGYKDGSPFLGRAERWWTMHRLKSVLLEVQMSSRPAKK